MKFARWALAAFALFFSSLAFAQPVQNFAFKDIYGKQYHFSQFKGKWVVVNYWATWCGSCKKEFPALRYIANKYRGRAVVIGMDTGNTAGNATNPHEMRRFVRQHRLNYIVAPLQDNTLFALGMIWSVPTTFIVNPRGQIVTSHMGLMTARQIQSYIEGRNER